MLVPNNTNTPYQSSLVQQQELPYYGYQPNSEMARLGWNSPYIQPSNANVATVAVNPATIPITPTNTTNNINSTSVYQPTTPALKIPSGQLFGYGTNAYGQTVFGGATGAQWAGLGIQAAFGAFNAYQAYKAQKLAKKQFEDQKRLNHANYQNQAKSFNNSIRNQLSGRGYIGMTSQAKQTLGREYNTRKAKEDY